MESYEDYTPKLYNPFPPEEEDIERENLELREYPLQEEDPAQEEETSFIEADNETLSNFFQKINMPHDYPRLESQKEELKIQEKEVLRKYFRDYLKISTSPSAGEKSKELYDNSKLILNKKSGTINGLEFKGKKLEERINNIESEVENTLNDVKEILSEQEIREVNVDIQNIILSKNLPIDNKLELLEIEKEHWKKKRIESAARTRKTFLESMQKLIEYHIDKLCIENDKKPRSEEGLELLRKEARNNDLARFERFKRWAKENLFGLSAAAIAIAGIISTAVMAGRSALKQGASELSKSAKAEAPPESSTPC